MGKPDYCYAFIENAIDYLAQGGKMVYLIPDSIYKNVYAQDLRDLILQYIVEIKDYPNKKLFDNAMTSSAVMLLKKGGFVSQLRYENMPKCKSILIDKTILRGKWIFGENYQRQEVCFGDFFKASMAIATQRNSIYVVSEKMIKKYGIERGAVRVAVSPRNQKYGKKEVIIFPYRISNNRVINYTEDEFRNKYPRTYTYLIHNKSELEKRDSDKSAQWFEYGRSQALQNMNKHKLMISTVFTNEIKVYEVNNRSIPYGGIYIVSNKGYDLNIAKTILESDKFIKYIKGIGTPASGSSLRITANDVNNFSFTREDFL